MAQRVIEHIDAAFFDRQRVGVAQERPCKSRDDEKKCEASQDEEQQIAKSARALAWHGFIIEKAQGGEFEEIRFLFPPQMQPDRRRQSNCAKPKPGIEKSQRQALKVLKPFN